MTAVCFEKVNPKDIKLQFSRAALLDEKIFSGGHYLDGLNRYAYCHDNPVRYVDPSGMDAYDFYTAMSQNQTQAAQAALGSQETHDAIVEATTTQAATDIVDGTLGNLSDEQPSPTPAEPTRSPTACGAVPFGTNLDLGHPKRNPPHTEPHAHDLETHTNSKTGASRTQIKKGQHARPEEDLTPEEKRQIEEMKKTGEDRRFIPAPAPKGDEQDQKGIGDSSTKSISVMNPVTEFLLGAAVGIYTRINEIDISLPQIPDSAANAGLTVGATAPLLFILGIGILAF